MFLTEQITRCHPNLPDQPYAIEQTLNGTGGCLTQPTINNTQIKNFCQSPSRIKSYFVNDINRYEPIEFTKPVLSSNASVNERIFQEMKSYAKLFLRLSRALGLNPSMLPEVLQVTTGTLLVHLVISLVLDPSDYPRLTT